MRRAALVLSCWAFSCVPALCWNGYRPHMEVAAVAWDRLNDKPEIQARITEQLRRNPLFDTWTSPTTTSEMPLRQPSSKSGLAGARLAKLLDAAQ